jgi:hypothetical protein
MRHPLVGAVNFSLPEQREKFARESRGLRDSSATCISEQGNHLLSRRLISSDAKSDATDSFAEYILKIYVFFFFHLGMPIIIFRLRRFRKTKGTTKARSSMHSSTYSPMNLTPRLSI